MADDFDKLHARDRIEEVDADQPLRPRQSLAQLLERDARRVGGENGVGLNLRLDAGEDLALQIENFRHSLDDQVRGGDAFALEIGDQAVERVAHSAAVVAADLAEQVGGALDRAGDRFRLGVAKADDKSVPRAPCGNVAAHGAGADDVDAFAVPFAVGETLEIFPQEKHANEILRGRGDEELRKGRNLRLLHRVRVAAVLLPQIDQRKRRRIVFMRRLFLGFAAHPRGEEPAHGAEIHQPAEQILLGGFPFAGNGRAHRGAHMAFLRHRIDQAKPLCRAGAFGFARQHHRHGLRRTDQARQPECAAEAGMQSEQNFGKAEARAVDGEAIVAGERDFEPAAETIAVDHSDRR